METWRQVVRILHAVADEWLNSPPIWEFVGVCGRG